ncbi:MAG: acyl-CoA dehydrogenase [Deltaproteobacteria bacterium]|nr:acyl-CoA dehydrogenase [Deltaproteobacteria bacterium]
MPDFIADLRDIKFALIEQAGIEKLFKTEKHKELDRGTVESILDEAYKFAREVLAPINAVGDADGAKFDKATGKVTLPKGFKEAFGLYRENGWLGFSASTEWGGQGMPYALQIAANDLFFGACLAFCLEALLTTGAAHLVETFGNDELKKIFLEKMYTGVWAGTMCLTEPGAGSDVGACRTKAKKEGDHYAIEGEKIFISYGEQDLTPNICHAVLARIEGAPEGTKGLSLFLVPKVRVKADGSLGEPNDVVCSGIEHKMGIHASPTCALVFGGNGKCHGYLLGEEHKGMRAMFQMMNEARIDVGLQGAALANAAYQLALAFARERKQGKNLVTGKDATILEHPDVRHMLMWQKAIAEGCRALLLRTAIFEDLANTSASEEDRNRYNGLVEILTPICKAYASDQGFRSAELSLQTMGGYGYLKEYGVEQYLRDNKIASIYEGTNGIQALDLMGRKLPAKGGADFKSLITLMSELTQKYAKHPTLGPEVGILAQARDVLVDVSMFFAAEGAKKPLLPVLNATVYLDLFGQVVVGWLLIEQATLAMPRLDAILKAKGVSLTDAAALQKLCDADADAKFYAGKVKVAQFYARRALTQCAAKAAVLKAGDQSALEVAL